MIGCIGVTAARHMLFDPAGQLLTIIRSSQS
jgi:hypothetical protein